MNYPDASNTKGIGRVCKEIALIHQIAEVSTVHLTSDTSKGTGQFHSPNTIRETGETLNTKWKKKTKLNKSSANSRASAARLSQ